MYVQIQIPLCYSVHLELSNYLERAQFMTIKTLTHSITYLIQINIYEYILKYIYIHDSSFRKMGLS